ncbi:MAG: DNA polymerase III subunit delta, partial [Pseudonocardiaceae bacterium]
MTTPTLPPAPLHLILGEEELLVERAVQAAVDAVKQADPTAEVSRVRTTDLAAGELDELVSPSLFAEGRAVVLLAAHEAGKDVAAT